MGLSAAATVLNLAFAIVVARAMGPTGRGVIAIAITIGTTTSLILSLGINISGRYYLPKADQGVGFGEYQGLALVLCVFEAGVSLLLGIWLIGSHPTYGGEMAVVLTVSYAVLSLLFYLLADALNAYNYIRLSVGISVGGSLIQLLLVVGLWMTRKLSIDLVLTVITIAMFLQTIVSYVALFRSGHKDVPRIDRRASWLLVKKGIPSIGYSAGQSLTFRLDRYVIAGFLGPAQLGIYSVAVAGSEALRVIPWAWAQQQFYQIASGVTKAKALTRQRNQLVLVMVPLLCIWGLATPIIVETLVGHAYMGAVTPWRILLIGELGIMVYEMDAAILSASGAVGLAGASGLAGLGVVLILDLSLIPSYGLVGAAAASAVAYLAMGIAANRSLRLTLRRQSRPGRRRSRGAQLPVEELDFNEGLE